MPKFGTKNALFEYFGARILKNYFHIWNEHHQIYPTAKFRKKWKYLNLEPQVPDLGIFWLEFQNTIVIFKISTLEFVNLSMPIYGTKNGLFGYFVARILKIYCRIWNQHPWICQTAKFQEKMKMSKSGTKSAVFGYFWARILKKLLSHLKSAPSNLS